MVFSPQGCERCIEERKIYLQSYRKRKGQVATCPYKGNERGRELLEVDYLLSLALASKVMRLNRLRILDLSRLP